VIGIKPTPAREYIEEEELEYNRLITDLAAEMNYLPLLIFGMLCSQKKVNASLNFLWKMDFTLMQKVMRYGQN
jgi:hypothetical protein